jgi:hypothetical protein
MILIVTLRFCTFVHGLGHVLGFPYVRQSVTEVNVMTNGIKNIFLVVHNSMSYRSLIFIKCKNRNKKIRRKEKKQITDFKLRTV